MKDGFEYLDTHADDIFKALEGGASGLLTKPIDFGDLELTIDKTIRHVEMMREARRRQAEAEIRALCCSEWLASDPVAAAVVRILDALPVKEPEVVSRAPPDRIFVAPVQGPVVVGQEELGEPEREAAGEPDLERPDGRTRNGPTAGKPA